MATVSGANGQGAGIGERCFAVIRRLGIKMIVLVHIPFWARGWCD